MRWGHVLVSVVAFVPAVQGVSGGTSLCVGPVEVRACAGLVDMLAPAVPSFLNLQQVLLPTLALRICAATASCCSEILCFGP